MIGLGIASPQALAEPPPPESVSRLVTDLASDSRVARTTAEAELIRLGSTAIELLPSPATVTDPAVRESLDRILRSIEQAESEAALQPQPVDWNHTKSLAAAITALATATGNTLDTPPLEQVPPTAPFPAQPLHFWEAIDWLETHTPLRYASGQLSHPNTPAPSLPHSLHGVFRVQLVSAIVRVTSTGTKLLGIKLRTTGEPRLRPLFLTAGVDDWAASQNGSTCAPFTPHARLETPCGHSGEADVSFDFVVPDSVTETTDWTISGHLDLTLSARSTPVTFSDLTAQLPLPRRRGQASLSLLSVKHDKASCSVRIASAFPDTSGLFESYRASLLAPEVTLIPPTGSPLSPTEITQIQADPQGLILESRFSAPLPEKARLQAIVPTAISTQKIPFRFEKVTLTEAPKSSVPQP